MTNKNKLKAKAMEKGLTMSDLAEKFGITKSTMSSKFNGKIQFSQTDIKKVSEILDLSSDEIREIFLQ